jgi:O-antigen/teichoic acid export membrane protein
VFTRILAAYLAVGLGLSLVAGEVVWAIAGHGRGKWAGAVTIIAPVVLAYFFLTASDLMDAGFYVTRRTAFKMPITLCSSAFTVGMYQWLIPRHGMLGAAAATLIGFLLQAVITWRVSQRVFPVRYEWGRVAAMLAMALVLWSVSLLLPVAVWAVPFKAMLWLGWPVALWWSGVVSGEEKQLARDLAGGLFRKARRVLPAAEAVPVGCSHERAA